MASFFGGFKVEKIKPALKMSQERIHLLKNKNAIAIGKSKKVVAELLREGKEEKARITTEHIVREDFLIEAYDILELMISVVLERIRLIDAEKECPFDMRESICTLIYAANRTDVKELVQVREQLTKKYGKEFTERAMANHNGCVNERIVQKLSAMPPNAFLVLQYMKELAQQYNIDWQPDETTAQIGSRFDVAMAPPTGRTIEAGTGSGLGASAYRYTDGSILPPGQVPSGFDANDIPAAPGATALGGTRPGGNAGGKGPGSAPSGGNTSNGGRGTGGAGGGVPIAAVVGDSDGASGGFSFDDIPMPPSSTPGATVRGAASSSASAGSKGNGAAAAAAAAAGGKAAPASSTFQDDPSTYGKDDEAVPDFDELTARFNALKRGG